MSSKILALSDIHGNIPGIMAVLNWAAGELTNSDMAVFLGDGLRELSFVEQQTALSCEWKKVRGNNDDYPTAPESEVFDFGGHRFYLCHGHRHALYSGYDKLAASALKAGADAVLFGHIHAPFHQNVNGLLLVSPGGIGRPRSDAGETFALIECMPEKPLKARFWGIESGCAIRELTLKNGLN